MSLTLTNADLRTLIAQGVTPELRAQIERVLRGGMMAASRKAASSGPAAGSRKHEHCILHMPMPDREAAGLEGRVMCFGPFDAKGRRRKGEVVPDNEVQARAAFVAAIAKSRAAYARKHPRVAGDGKLAWLDGKRIRPSQLKAAMDRAELERGKSGKRVVDTVRPGDCFITRGSGAWVKPIPLAKYRSTNSSTRRRSRKAEIVVRARA
jgi:hypothetical protein